MKQYYACRIGKEDGDQRSWRISYKVDSPREAFLECWGCPPVKEDKIVALGARKKEAFEKFFALLRGGDPT